MIIMLNRAIKNDSSYWFSPPPSGGRRLPLPEPSSGGGFPVKGEFFFLLLPSIGSYRVHLNVVGFSVLLFLFGAI